MRILLTNDDGINSAGLEKLFNFVNELENVDEVWVIAPEANMSSKGHSITYNEVLNVHEVQENIYSVNGTAADCVIIGLQYLMKDNPPDIIISGINPYPHTGFIDSSGTISAAREAYIWGTNAISLSQNLEKPGAVSIAEYPEFIDFIQKWINLPPQDYFLNINLPTTNEIRGIKYVEQETHRLPINVYETEDGPYIKKNKEAAYDLGYLDEGYIIVTPLHNNCTDYNTLENFMCMV